MQIFLESTLILQLVFWIDDISLILLGRSVTPDGTRFRWEMKGHFGSQVPHRRAKPEDGAQAQENSWPWKGWASDQLSGANGLLLQVVGAQRVPVFKGCVLEASFTDMFCLPSTVSKICLICCQGLQLGRI